MPLNFKLSVQLKIPKASGSSWIRKTGWTDHNANHYTWRDAFCNSDAGNFLVLKIDQSIRTRKIGARQEPHKVHFRKSVLAKPSAPQMSYAYIIFKHYFSSHHSIVLCGSHLSPLLMKCLILDSKLQVRTRPELKQGSVTRQGTWNYFSALKCWLLFGC